MGYSCALCRTGSCGKQSLKHEARVATDETWVGCAPIRRIRVIRVPFASPKEESFVRNLVTFAAIIEIIAITIWVGGMAALAFIAAPAIFQTAASRESAGKTFGLMLKRFHWVMYACGAVVLLAGVLRWLGSFNHRLLASELTRYVIAALMLALALYSGLVVARGLDRLRAQMPNGIDRVAKDDERRVQFNRLHRLSTTLMAFNLLLGLALAVMFALEG